MFFDLVSNIAEQSERIGHTEMTLEMDSLRAEIENCDQKIAFYEADIIACDRENDEMATELEMLREEAQNLSTETVKLPAKAAKYSRILEKYESETNKCLDDMAAVKNSIENFSASLDESQRANLRASNARLNELRQAVDKRKKLIEETGYENRKDDQNRMANQLAVARTRLAELQAKYKDALKPVSEMETEEEPQLSDHKTKHRSKKSKHSGIQDGKKVNAAKRSSRR